MNRTLHFHVDGDPAPQGSYIQGKTKEGRTFFRPDNPRSIPWRDRMQAEAERAANDLWQGGRVLLFTGGIVVSATFRIERPKTHYRSGKFAHLLRDDAPKFPSVGGRGPTANNDADKYARALLDALTKARVYGDDIQVVDLHIYKRYAQTSPEFSVQISPGVTVAVQQIEEDASDEG